MTTNLTDCIATACDLKQQMNNHFDSLYARLSQPQAFNKEKADAGKVLTRQYAPAIRDIVDATTLADLVERRDSLNKTLHKGWTYCALHPADKDAYDAWEARLLEMTVISDCIDHIKIINSTLDRIALIESMVQPLEQGVLV